MNLRKKEILCLINLPNKTTLAYFVHRDCKGRDLLKTICDELGILEIDYFGLLITNQSSTLITTWLNLRNSIVTETGFQHPVVLDLSVKFFVELHHLQQNITRQLFFQTAAQATNMNANLTNQLSQITTNHPSLFKSLFVSDNEATSARNEFSRLMVSHMEAWGHTHRATIGDMNMVVVTAPDGIKLYNSTANQMLRMHQWCSIQMAIQSSRTINVTILNDNSTTTSMEVILNSKREADALYRDLTEVYSFYCCDTVFDSVTQQVSRDFKGVIVSIFNESAYTGRRYVFDVETTLKETYEKVRRKLYRIETEQNSEKTSSKNLPPTEESTVISDECSNANDKLQAIIEAFKCLLCCSEEISTSFIPCGHLVSCHACSQKISTCPLCNASIDNVQKIYLPTQLT